MKTFVLLSFIVAVAIAAPPKSSDDVSILSRSFANDGNNYEFAFEQSDGQKRDEKGEVKVKTLALNKNRFFFIVLCILGYRQGIRNCDERKLLVRR
jgi:hypothetical protein